MSRLSVEQHDNPSPHLPDWKIAGVADRKKGATRRKLLLRCETCRRTKVLKMNVSNGPWQYR